MRIALIQQALGEDVHENRERAVEAARGAKEQGAQLIAYPELSFTRFWPRTPAGSESRSLAEPIPGPTTELFCELARELEVVMVLNLYEKKGDQRFDSSPVIDADGTLLGTTRMFHITDFPCFHENGYYDPAPAPLRVFDTRVGRVGVAICYDRHYPEVMRGLGLAGAQWVIVPQAGTVGEWPDGMYQAEVRTAAFQNGYYAALCNRTGTEEGMAFGGESFVCDPRGKIVAQAGLEETVLVADLDESALEDCSARQLLLVRRDIKTSSRP